MMIQINRKIGSLDYSEIPKTEKGGYSIIRLFDKFLEEHKYTKYFSL